MRLNAVWSRDWSVLKRLASVCLAGSCQGQGRYTNAISWAANSLSQQHKTLNELCLNMSVHRTFLSHETIFISSLFCVWWGQGVMKLVLWRRRKWYYKKERRLMGNKNFSLMKDNIHASENYICYNYSMDERVQPKYLGIVLSTGHCEPLSLDWGLVCRWMGEVERDSGEICSWNVAWLHCTLLHIYLFIHLLFLIYGHDGLHKIMFLHILFAVSFSSVNILRHVLKSLWLLLTAHLLTSFDCWIDDRGVATCRPSALNMILIWMKWNTKEELQP